VTTTTLQVHARVGAAPALRALAVLALTAMFVVVTASAFLRHLGATEALQTAWAGSLMTARLVHRVAATLVLLGAVLMVLLARRERHAGRAAVLAAAVALLGVALLLSAVGVVAGASRALPVVLVNLLGGFTMLALCARLALSAATAGVGRSAWVLLALAVAQAAGGAAAGAYAPAGCVGLSDCGVLALLHRISGAALACALLAFGLWASWRTRRRAGTWLCACATLLLLVGSLNAGLGGAAAPLLVVVHNALAAAALALLARLG
jgi:hypothetical protein